MNHDPTTPAFDRERLLELAAAYCDELATDAEVAELESLVEANAAAGRTFIAYAMVHGQLPLVAGTGVAAARDVADVRAVLAPRASAGPKRFGRIALAVATVVGAIFGVIWVTGRVEPGAAAPLAILTDARFIVPADPRERFRAGQTITAGRFAIKSGAAELTLTTGVTLLLDGPVEIDLVDGMSAILHSGSVVVRVPKGMSGFRLDTATAEVLDLGTEFAVRIGSGLVTDVQVYDGAVIASSIGNGGPGFPCRIEAGEAQRFSPEATIDPKRIRFEDSRFLRTLPADTGTGQPFLSTEVDERQFGQPLQDRITVRPAPASVVIDGGLDEWPTTPAFRNSFRGASDAAEWVEGWMMYDAERLYIAARVGDPSPLQSTISPDLDPDKGWIGGGVQLRISTDRSAGWPVTGNSQGYYWLRNRPELPTPAERAAATNPKLNHVIMWHHAPTGRACLSLTHGMLHAEYEGNPAGYEGAFSPFPDGRGYVLEYAIPWSLLNTADDPPRAGDLLAAAWQVHFADGTGRIWRRQIIDVRNPAEPYRIGVWQRAATWGRAEFE